MAALRRTTDATVEPWTAAEIKRHLHGVAESELDADIEQKITECRQAAEVFLNRSLITQTWQLNLDDFPAADGGLIRLRKAPVSSLSSVKYYDADGVQQTLVSGTDYQVEYASEPARLMPEPGTTWPSVETDRLNAVEVIYVAGYGAAATDVPGPIRRAIALMVGHYYEHREEVSELKLAKIPAGAERLLWQCRMKEA